MISTQFAIYFGPVDGVPRKYVLSRDQITWTDTNIANVEISEYLWLFHFLPPDPAPA